MIPLNKETEEVAQAIVRLQNGAEAQAFGVFVGWLQKSRERQWANNDLLNGNDLYRGLGRSLNCGEILEGIAEAETVLRQLKQGIQTSSEDDGKNW